MSFYIPSPVNKLSFSADDGKLHTLSIKRDDAIHPQISGNKWRKLALHFNQFPKLRYKGLVTFGGPWSNHLLACAAACQIYGISSLGFVRGDYHYYKNSILQECENYGMELRFLSNQAYNEAKSQPLKFINASNLSDYLMIPIGGDDDLGILGSEKIIQEVLAAEYCPSIWLIPAGTGATAAGILKALPYECLVQVYPAINRSQDINLLQAKLAAIPSKANFQIMNCHPCRFGAVDEPLIDFIRSFHQQTRILLDPLYNGKMMHTFFKERISTTDDQVMAYHSGGLSGWKGIIPKWNSRVDLTFLESLDLNTSPTQV